MAKPTPLPKFDRRTRVSDAGPAVIARRLADVRRCEKAVVETLDADVIHDMRVAARRLRVALDAFGMRSLEPGVKRLQDALGLVRDVQVQALWLKQGIRPAERQGVERLKARLEAQLPARTRALREEIERWRTVTVGLVEAGTGKLASHDRLGGGQLRKRLRKRIAIVDVRIGRFAKSADPVTAHRLRIAVKKLRYWTELLAQAWPAQTKRLLADLVPLQDELGALHDADVRLSVFEQLAGGRGEKGTRALLDRVRRERATLAKHARGRVDAWAAEDHVRKLKRLFARRVLAAG